MLQPNVDMYYTNISASYDQVISVWQRPSINWSLECEANNQTRSMGIQAIDTPAVTSTIPNDYFFRMGLALVIGISSLFVISLLAHLIWLKKNTPAETFKWMFYVMFIPSRVTFCVWGPWIAGAAGQHRDDLKTSRTNVEKMDIINQCGDAESQLDIEPVQNDIQQGIDELNLIYWISWCTLILFVIEFAVMAIMCFRRCLNKTAKKHEMKRNHSNADITYVKVDSGNNNNNNSYQQIQPGQPVQGYPVQQQSMMMDPNMS